MKISKRKFITAFFAVVVVLSVVRETLSGRLTAEDAAVVTDTVQAIPAAVADVEGHQHKIGYVPPYKTTFPDSQQVQLQAAERWGVRPVANRADAEARKKELVYVGASPYYHVDPLRSSLPYLVPRAAVLLQDIGQAFYDSLYVKGIPFNQFIVTSVLRSEEDVSKLRRRNGNATERSCHLFGTTFDVCYNRYHPVARPVRNDTLKWVLTQVLRDIREQERCYIKYEVKQGCFHMTVR